MLTLTSYDLLLVSTLNCMIACDNLKAYLFTKFYYSLSPYMERFSDNEVEPELVDAM